MLTKDFNDKVKNIDGDYTTFIYKGEINTYIITFCVTNYKTFTTLHSVISSKIKLLIYSIIY